MAAHLTAGDGCAAAAEADDLLHETVRAVNDGQVPPPLQEELLASANELVQSIECVPAPPAPEPPARDGDDGDDGDGEDDDDDDDGPGEGKGKGRG